MVELRKRPPPKEPPASQPAAKRGSGAGSKVKKLAKKAKAAVTGGAPAGPPDTAGAPVAAGEGGDEVMVDKQTGAIPETTTTPGDQSEVVGAPATSALAAPASGASASTKLGRESVGQAIDSDGFGGKVTRHDGVETSLAELLDASGSGVVVFTYPKASTPGCTTQACLFRDSYAPITGASLAMYGLSTDSVKANTTFVNKNSLPYPLLCDPDATLTSAIGMKKPGPGKSTSRGVVVIDKQGVVRVWEQGGPQKTLDAVLEYIKTQGMTETGAPAAVAAPPAADPKATKAAATLADPWEDHKMDEVPLIRTPTNEEREAAETAAEVGEVAAKIDSAEEVRS